MEEEKEVFVIDTDEKAEWALKKIKEAKVERDRLTSLALLEKERLDRQIEGFEEQYQRDTEWLTYSLEQYFNTVYHKCTATQEKYQPLSGSLIRKKQQPKYTRDDSVMMGWLKQNHMDDFVKTKESVDWENLKKITTISEGKVMLADTGEVIEGVEVEAVPDKFMVQL